ncbi:MAG: hypothetical protein COU51_03200 [Parcubacteria group bacterium CG10_big_fil_rev_8_21_14_0_10_36_14]|nr:MAG: hypothetical protein COU51_03200 [Parcubacteria group bacterium CG10_big_fil_rev_8_21_14_0_10_36_14]
MKKKKYRPFKISCGLKEGYGASAKIHTITEVRKLIQKWIEERIKSGEKVVVGTLFKGQFIYPWIEGKKISSKYEPAFHYKGIIRDDASDKEAIEMLENLAKELAKKFKQHRIHIEFCSDYFVIENK